MNRDPAGDFYLLWNKSCTSCCPLPSVKIKLAFSGMNNAEVFYYHIENCTGNKLRCNNVLKNPKPEQKLNSDTPNPKRIVLIKKSEKSDVLNFSNSPFICFLISLFIFPPPPSPPFISFVLAFVILTCLQFSLLLRWRHDLAGCKLANSLAMSNAAAPSQSSVYAGHLCRWECSFCASANA